MTMTIMPAFFLTISCIIINIAAEFIGLALNIRVTLLWDSLFDCLRKFLSTAVLPGPDNNNYRVETDTLQHSQEAALHPYFPYIYVHIYTYFGCRPLCKGELEAHNTHKNQRCRQSQ